MPRLSPAFCAPLLPGLSTVPRADRVTTLRFSARITSKAWARLLVVLSTQSLRRSASLTFKPAIRVFAFLPAAGNPSGTSEPALKPQEQIGFLGPQTLRAGHLSGDSSTATATPPSTATTPPVPGAATGWGITANAICQRPDLSPVMGTTSARQGLGCL